MEIITNYQDENQEYPLSFSWVLWFHKVDDNNWNDDSYKQVCSIKSIKDFCSVFNHLTDITKGIFFLMREGVFPKWEDPSLINGGYFSFKIQKKICDETFQQLSYACIGNTIMKNPEDAENVVGIQISPKINNCIIKIFLNKKEKLLAELMADDLPNLYKKNINIKAHQEAIKDDKENLEYLEIHNKNKEKDI